jgi:hypothetical protein
LNRLKPKPANIDIFEVEIQAPRNFFDYVFESLAVFAAAGREHDRVLEQKTAERVSALGDVDMVRSA